MAKRNMRLSVKRLQIDKASSVIVISVGIAAFVTAFSLVMMKSLLAERSYQKTVTEKREKALDVLEANVAATDELKTKYYEFVNRQENIIGGSSQANGDRDGDNARIILDALPSKYDFPALASSLEKILKDRNYTIKSIVGVDDEANQNNSGQGQAKGTLSQPQASQITSGSAPNQTQASVPSNGAIEMPFEVGADGSYQSIVDLLGILDKSIRPMNIQSMSLKASDGNRVELSIKGKSYYQPSKTLNIPEEVVK